MGNRFNCNRQYVLYKPIQVHAAPNRKLVARSPSRPCRSRLSSCRYSHPDMYLHLFNYWLCWHQVYELSHQQYYIMLTPRSKNYKHICKLGFGFERCCVKCYIHIAQIEMLLVIALPVTSIISLP